MPESERKEPTTHPHQGASKYISQSPPATAQSPPFLRRSHGRAEPGPAAPARGIMKLPGRRALAFGGCALLLAAFFLPGTLVTTTLPPFLMLPPLSLPCLPTVDAPSGSGYAAPGAAVLAEAAVEYAVTPTVPQQSRDEISVSLAVLRRRAPLRLLVFGLGHDSALWHALNPGGATVFLEEDPAWYRVVRVRSPHLRAHLVAYRTRLDHADELLATYKTHPACLPGSDGGVSVRGNEECPLALHNLPPEVYENEWDMVMVDAPKGYFAAAPGRMAAIWTAAAMARLRRGEGNTDVFLHDVDRKVEREYAEEFLCHKFRVGGVGRLWHFSIPPMSLRRNTTGGRRPFC
jgi:uncharacterized protein (TIGR01627 family)